jgi:pimeloyl-ACP methyl ester carboxylesterase
MAVHKNAPISRRWPAHRLRTVGALCLATSLLTGCGSGGGDGGQRPVSSETGPVGDTIPVAPARWTDCGGGLQCADVEAPVDYTRPGSASLRLAVARKPADEPSRRVGVLIFNPGGPALSGVQTLRVSTGLFPPEIKRRFDIVTFDPRGSGKSGQLTCGPTPAAATAAEPTGSAGEALPATTVYRQLAEDCMRRYPSLLPLVNTTNTARDLDRVRRALNEPTVSFLGLSYGTLLGAEYLRLFPQHVRAAILDAPIDPGTSVTDAAADQAAAAETALRDALAAGTAGTPAAFDALRLRLSHEPLPAPGHGDTTPVTEGDLDLATLTYLAAPALTPGYPGALAAAAHGDGSGLRSLATQQFTDIDGSSALTPYWTISCNDVADRPSPADAGALARRLAARFPRLGGEAVSFYLGACPVWPPAQEPVAASRGVSVDTPVLVIGGTEDPITPYSWAGRVTAELKRATLLTRVGGGHTAFVTSTANSCLTQYETTYLIDRIPPPTGTRCDSS